MKHLAQSGGKLNVEQGAVVVLSTDGAVRALVGGRNYVESQFNRATQALRQPGSSFKPIVYLAGIESGLGPDDIVLDAPINIHGWRPHNFTNRYAGPVTIETALAESLNTAAVRVAQHAGIKNVIATARRLGFSEELKPDLSIAQGLGRRTTLLDRDGRRLHALCQRRRSGGALRHRQHRRSERRQVLYTREPGTLGQVDSDRTKSRSMNRMMSQVLIRGTGKAATFGFPAAGKTGTSSDYRDAWFMGFTSDFVGGVWVGNDDREQMNKVVGGGLPAQIWHDVMVAAHAGRTPHYDLPGACAPGGDGGSPRRRDGHDGLGGLIGQIVGQ